MAKDLPFRAKRTLLVFFGAVLLLAFVAPFTLPHGSVTDLSGTVGTINNADQIERMNPLAAAVYLFGDFNCHQIKERSFVLNGNEMPFCSRCTGIVIGLVAGMALALAFSPRFSWLALIVLCAPIVLDGGMQMISSYQSTNLLRLITGILGGIGASYFLAHVADVFLTVPNADAHAKA